ncbi:unnamed protein product [Didymodactylos carnosus]|uniref:Uncharacterized protein n=1 Tax=Didymodactylos carnosus TaxID=1234261 RepID=A0A815T9Y9_9BILA|nr:unnamed protein product [Didymodactylos carnosus]CAF4364476.1 unnamed protein product [Didymodactylos carnosus]
MDCTCYDYSELRCVTSKSLLHGLSLVKNLTKQNFRTLDFKFDSIKFDLQADYFSSLTNIIDNSGNSYISITFRYHNFELFHSHTAAFRSLFDNVKRQNRSRTRLTIELQPVKPKSIIFDSNSFENLHLDELSIYADSISSPFESVFNQTHIIHLNIEGAIVQHDPELVKTFTGKIKAFKITRMIDTMNSDEFPPFPVESYIIEAHKLRKLEAATFENYTQLNGINIIQPDVSITPQLLMGLEKIIKLNSMSFDAERIADGALKYVKQIQTVAFGPYLKMIDIDSLQSLKLLRQLDVRYVQFPTLQGNSSCLLTDFINKRRMDDLTVYLPQENPDCDCSLIFLNNIIDDGSQLKQCLETTNDRCLFSSCPFIADYFQRQQQEQQQEQQRLQQEQQRLQQEQQRLQQEQQRAQNELTSTKPDTKRINVPYGEELDEEHSVPPNVVNTFDTLVPVLVDFEASPPLNDFKEQVITTTTEPIATTTTTEILDVDPDNVNDNDQSKEITTNTYAKVTTTDSDFLQFFSQHQLNVV